MANSSEYDASISNLCKSISFMKMVKRKCEHLFFLIGIDVFTEHTSYRGHSNSLIIQRIPAF